MILTMVMSIFIFNADFPICTADDAQQYPCAIFANNQYYVFWADNRYFVAESTHAIFGARVGQDGTVIDPDGKLLFKRMAAATPCAAYDGTNFLVVFRDSC
ncbi:MAG: hypothetical protein JSV97_13195 [candidate division WOR-3 bacterium]|nr:MAG: hypothetical protein JSV97_13195 [candidate division WOR-3 bacterium]